MKIFCPTHKNEKLSMMSYGGIVLTKKSKKRTLKHIGTNYFYCVKCKKARRVIKVRFEN